MTERLYYNDTALQNFHAKVMDIRELSQADGQSLWQISLDRSAFYPTSGGQPFDTGILKTTSRSGAILEIPIVGVEEDEAGIVWHSTSKPLPTGAEVEGVIEWSRRFDHMQQHSGQHLLSAVFAKELNANTVSFHLGQESSTIDLDIFLLDSSAMERVEDVVNQLIVEGREIQAQYVSRAEADRLLAEGKLRKLPPREGTIRLIAIEDYDLNACGGTHLSSTSQLGSCLLRSTEKVKKGIRVEFVCGARAVKAARTDYELLSKVASSLSLRKEETAEAVGRLLLEMKAAGKEKQRLKETIAEYQAPLLATQAVSWESWKLARLSFPYEDAAYIKLLASRVIANIPDIVVLFASTLQDPSPVVFAAGSGVGFSCGDTLRAELAKLGLRGGGSRDMAQGQVPRSQVEAFFDSVLKAITTK